MQCPPWVPVKIAPLIMTLTSEKPRIATMKNNPNTLTAGIQGLNDALTAGIQGLNDALTAGIQGWNDALTAGIQGWNDALTAGVQGWNDAAFTARIRDRPCLVARVRFRLIGCRPCLIITYGQQATTTTGGP